MTNDVLLKLLTRLLQENEVAYTSVAPGARDDIELWGRRKGCFVLEKIGNGKKFRVTNRKTLEFEINRLQPGIDLQNLSSRLQNLAVNKNTKSGETTLDYTYCICKAVGDVVVNGVDVSLISKTLGCFSLAVCDNCEGIQCNGSLMLVENQQMIDDLKWVPADFSGVILYYAGNLSERVLNWLKRSSFESIWHFPDYDAVGISNYSNLKDVLPIAQWYWMPNWESALEKFGNKELWAKDNQQALFENLWEKFKENGFPDVGLEKLMIEIRKQGKMLEQESVLI